ncbi:MAG: 50S ribosomal protein L11 methyltransferase [Clostridia bacterium]|nr:50S ribosomal protein L11 methyltransferase [Clostridia bacterium]
MRLIELTARTIPELTDIVCAEIYDFGVMGVSIEDKNDIREFLENNKQFWDYVDDELLNGSDDFVYIKTYMNDDQVGNELYSDIAAQLSGMENVTVSKAYVDDQDWANNWKKYFKPFAVGDTFIVSPTWEHVEDPGNRTIIRIDPGMAFGTGQHHTTKLCLEYIEENARPGDKVLDMGCGSGILAIAALYAGAEHATLVDIDSIATETAAENMKVNGFPDNRYNVMTGNVLGNAAFANKIPDREYDLITANIVADIIKAMKDLFKSYIKPDGLLLCSGIITERAEEVLEALESAGFAKVSAKTSGDWTALLMRAPK